MRNLEQCKAEVLRRSENRIKERRKKRRQVVAWCVPLVLCMTVFLGIMLPSMGEKAKSAEWDYLDGAMTENGYVCDYQEVVIQDSGGSSRNVTSPEEVAELYEAIYALDPSIGTGQRETVGTVDPEAPIYGNEERTGRAITFFRTDGGSISYILEGNVLYNLTWNLEIPLTQEQAAELRAALGIEE